MPERLGSIREIISGRAAPRRGRARLAIDGQPGLVVHVTGSRRVVLRLWIDVGAHGDVPLDGPTVLSAAWDGPPLPGLDARSISVQLDRLQRSGEVAQWRLDLHPGLVSGAHTLRLSVDGTELDPLVMEVVVGATPETADAALHPHVEVHVDLEAADHETDAPLVRLLVEEAEHEGRLRIWGQCPGRDDFKDSVPRPSKVYVDTDELSRSKAFFAGILRWSNRSGALVRWLAGALEAHPDAVVLIEDELASGEPFELLFFDRQKRATLGSKARVVRWNTVQTFEGEQAFELHRPPEEGPALCVVETGVDPRGVETQAARQLGALAEGLDDLLRIHGSTDPPPALVHIASHATWSVSEAHKRGLGASDDGAELTELDFTFVDPPKEAAAVFANACHSGRLAVDDSLELTGLPLTFLEDHAWLFIGTLGRMSSSVAAEVGARFLAAAASTEGVDPAAFFRDLRRERLDAVREAMASGQGLALALRHYLHAGLYVVYGPAHTRIRVVRHG
jgi:hypothetical protein